MKIIYAYQLKNLNSGTVATLGTFDGLHLGHQKIIQKTIKEAKALGKKSALITFDKHPKEVLYPQKSLQVLTALETKIKLLSQFNLDYLIILEFTPKLAALSPEEFCDRILIEKLKVKHLFVGENFRFGAKAAGTTDFLKDYGSRKDIQVTVVPLQVIGKTVISSTKIRSLLKEGLVEKVPSFLGRYHFVTGLVTPGEGRGKNLGYPTANLNLDKGLCLPKKGVYAGYLPLDNHHLPAIMNIGTNPTFGSVPLRCEIHVFDFSFDIYGKTIAVEIQKRIREEKTFPSPEALVTQVSKDIQIAKNWLKNHESSFMLYS